MKIATFNVNGIAGRWESFAQWLTREQPDVACLQELKVPQDRFPAAAIRDLGYQSIWQGQQSWNGVAILSKVGEPIESRRGLPGDPTDQQSRYIEAAVRGVIIACLYAPNGNPQPGPKFEYKLAWLERLRKHAATLVRLDYPVILAGDFNVVPTDFDIYNPTSWKKNALLQPESRAAYVELLKQGWTDTIRARHPDAQIFTFWDYFRNHWARNAGLRIDHLLANAVAAGRVEGVGVDAWVRGLPKASDHAPAWIVLGEKRRRVSAKKNSERRQPPSKRPTRSSTTRDRGRKQAQFAPITGNASRSREACEHQEGLPNTSVAIGCESVRAQSAGYASHERVRERARCEAWARAVLVVRLRALAFSRSALRRASA